MKTLKFLAITLIISILMCSISVTSFSQEMISSTYEEQVIECAQELTGYNMDNAEIIIINSINSTSRNVNMEKAIKIKQDNGIIIIIPKTVIESNDVVNSFEYAETKLKTRDYHINNTNLVNLTLNLSCYYSETFILSEILRLYTPSSLYFSWNSDNSTAYVNDINVEYESLGDVWKINPLTDMNYVMRVFFDIYEVNPNEGIAYGDWADAMNDNLGLECTYAEGHGGNLWYSINYTVNGVTRYANGSYNLY